MNEKPEKTRDYSETLFLPKTDFPMRAGLPQKEPEILKRWRKLDLYGRLRAAAKGRPRFILHDGPPYANGNIHIGHALNKILKDVVTKSHQMLGFDFVLRAGLGLPRPADRMEDRGGELSRQRQAETGSVQSSRVGRIPQGVPRLRRALDRGAARRIRAARRHWRLGASLHHHGSFRRGADRARTDEVRGQRHALSRLQAGDVVGGGKDRARRSRSRVRGLHVRHGVGEVSGQKLFLKGLQLQPKAGRTANAPVQFVGCHLDDHAVDVAWQSGNHLQSENFIWDLLDQGCSRR